VVLYGYLFIKLLIWFSSQLCVFWSVFKAVSMAVN